MVTSTTILQGVSFVMLNCTKLGQEQVRFEDSYLDGRSTRCLKTDCASLLQTVCSYVVSKLYRSETIALKEFCLSLGVMMAFRIPVVWYVVTYQNIPQNKSTQSNTVKTS